MGESRTPQVSVVVRSRNDIGLIERTISALQRQTLPHEIISLDNASDDGTRDVLEARGVTIHDVPAGRYIPGRVLNRGVELAQTDIVAFVNSDAPPVHDEFLERLVAPILAGRADACWARQLARPDARTLTRIDHDRMFGEQAPPASWGIRFSLASSAIRKSRLLERPFREDIQYSEDLEWVVAMQDRGLTVEYVPEARSEHSHDYTLQETWKRFFEEGRADAVIFANGGRPLRPFRAPLGVARDVLRDVRRSLRDGEPASAALSPVLRTIQRSAYIAGRLAGPREKLGA